MPITIDRNPEGLMARNAGVYVEDRCLMAAIDITNGVCPRHT
ncbi:TPA: hypothetical protein ACIPUI_002364 [Citrobacter freundii]